MPFNTNNKIELVDASGDPLDLGSGALSTETLRVTIADNDPHFGAVGSSADSDGNIHGQLLYIASKAADMDILLTTIDVDTDAIKSYTGMPLKTIGTDTYTEGSSVGQAIAAVRNDTLAALAGTDNEFAPLQVNAEGALYTTGNTLHNGVLHGENFTIMGESKTIDGSALPNDVAEGRNARLAVSRSGIAYTCLTDPDGASDLGTTITTHLSEIEGAIETIEGAISGSEMQVDIVAALPAGTNAIGKLSANSGVDIGDVTVDNLGDWVARDVGATASVARVPTNNYSALDAVITAGVVCKDVLAAHSNVTDDEYTTLQVDTQGALYTTHGITGMVSDMDADVGTSAENIHTAGDVAIKRIDVQASPDNTGYIYVGDSGVAGNGTGGGIKLAAGDFYSLDIDNTGDVYVAASVADEDVSYIYYT